MNTGCAHKVGTRRPRVAGLLIFLVLFMVAFSGCKSQEKEKEIAKIKKNLKAMLKNPVDMHAARLDEAQQRFSEQLATLMKKPDEKLRAKVLKEIVEEADSLKVRLFGDEIVAVGISPDNWTVNGEPAGFLISNPDDVPLKAKMMISTGAPPETYPLSLVVMDGAKKETVVFKEMGGQEVTFPEVPAKSKRLFIVDTDKTWTPGTHDKRKLGVRFSVSMQPYLARMMDQGAETRRAALLEAIFKRQISDYQPILDPNVLAVSLTPDGWTRAGGPSGLAVWASGDKPFTPRLTLSCNAKPRDLPITATFQGVVKAIKFTFRKPGHQLVTLPEVPAGTKRLYLVTTDKTASEGERQGLGIRITNPLDGSLRSLLTKRDPQLRAQVIEDLFMLEIDKMNILGDLAVAIGLSGDRWTVDGQPAGLALANPGEDRPMTPKVNLSCGATGDSAPITAIVDDGVQKQTVTFNTPGTKEVVLSIVPPGKKKLYIITTDKTWTPGTHDKRQLGVNVGITLGAVLKGMLYGASDTTRTRVAKAIMQSPMQGKVALGSDYLVAAGVSADRWTMDGQPAAVVGYNKGDVAWAPRAMFSVGAKDKDLPVTVLIDDGKEATKVEFKKADAKLVTLSPISPGMHRLYVITTDRSWSLPPQDPRNLGVNIRPAPGNQPPGVGKAKAVAAPATEAEPAADEAEPATEAAAPTPSATPTPSAPPAKAAPVAGAGEAG